MSDPGLWQASPEAARCQKVMLQIDSPGDDSPLRFPALVRNLVGSVATLEVKDPWTLLNWESLRGRPGGVQLVGSPDEVAELRGIVAWAKYTCTGSDSGQLSLALQLTNPEPITLKLLQSHIQDGTEDMKSLWDRWDQAHNQGHQGLGEVLSVNYGFLALALLCSSLVVNRIWPNPYRLFSWVLWLFGSAVVAGQVWQCWKKVRAER